MIALLLDTNLLVDEPDMSLLGEPEDEITLCTAALSYAEFQDGEFSTDPVVAATFMLKQADVKQSLGDGIPFGEAELVAYRAICAAVVASGRQLNRARRMDLMIAATALANGMTLATRNIDDFAGLEQVVPVVQL